MHARVIITEAGDVVTATHLVVGQSEHAVTDTAKQHMRTIIQKVLSDDRCGNVLSNEELEKALTQGYYWISLPHEEFTIMIIQPERIVAV